MAACDFLTKTVKDLFIWAKDIVGRLAKGIVGRLAKGIVGRLAKGIDGGTSYSLWASGIDGRR